MAQRAFAWEILVFPRENHFWNFESQWQAEQSICKNEAGGFYFEMKNQKKKWNWQPMPQSLGQTMTFFIVMSLSWVLAIPEHEKEKLATH